MSVVERTSPRVSHVCGSCYRAISGSANAVVMGWGDPTYGLRRRYFCSQECAEAWQVLRQLRDLDPGVFLSL